MWLLRRKKEVESEIALLEAQKSLELIKARTPEVKKVKHATQRLLRKNHFTEQLGDIMWGHQ